MDRTSRTHFGMDERGLGGTYMIQQQFLHMYRRIQTAEKIVDNKPPATGMFRRPTFSRFGEYWRRVQPVQYDVGSKVDHAPPASFPLLEDLYINQPATPGAAFAAAHKSKKKALPKEAQSTLDLEHAAVIEGVDVTDMPESMIAYLASIHKRKGAVEKELSAIRQRRLLRHEVQARTPPIGRCTGSSMMATLARDTIYSLDACARDQATTPAVGCVAERPDQSFGELLPGSPVVDGNAVCDALLPLQSLVLRAPASFENGPVEQELSKKYPVSLERQGSSRSFASGGGTQRGASMRMTKSGAFLNVESGTHGAPPMTKSISALDPELLAASAPKKLVARKPGSNAKGERAPRSRNAQHTEHHHENNFWVSQPAVPQQQATVQLTQAAPGTSRLMLGTGHRYAATDSSMAGHSYDPLVVPTLGASAAIPALPSGQLQPVPTKVVGLVQSYGGDEDAANCDDHS